MPAAELHGAARPRDGQPVQGPQPSAKIASTSSWNARPWANLKTSVGADYTNLEIDGASTGGTTLPPGGSTVAASSTKSASDQQPTASKTLGLYVQEQAALRDRLFLTGARPHGPEQRVRSELPAACSIRR